MKDLVKKIAVKGITESGSTATESYVYLESINLSKAAPTATIQFDYKGANKVSLQIDIDQDDIKADVIKLVLGNRVLEIKNKDWRP